MVRISSRPVTRSARARGLRACVLTLALTVLAPIGPVAHAAPPDLPLETIQLVGRPSAEEQRRINEFTDFWLDELESDDNERVLPAAEALVRPAANRTTQSFRTAYGQAVFDRLEDLAENGGSLQSWQSLRILGFVGTTEAMSFAARRSSNAREPRSEVRLWAAKACRVIFDRYIAEGGFNQNQIEGAVRDLGRAGRSETDPLVIRSIFDALRAEGSQTARLEQIEVLREAIERRRQADGASADQMEAIGHAVLALRDQYLQPRVPMAGEQSDEFERLLVPVLVSVMQAADGHWDGARARSSVSSAYGTTIAAAETLLRLLDRNHRNGAQQPGDVLGRAFGRNDRAAFSEAIAGWQQIVSQPPYRRR